MRGASFSRVERFDRRPIEPFELFTSEFGQNSVRTSPFRDRVAELRGPTEGLEGKSSALFEYPAASQ